MTGISLDIISNFQNPLKKLWSHLNEKFSILNFDLMEFYT